MQVQVILDFLSAVIAVFDTEIKLQRKQVSRM
jgi:hypothetical protein